MPSNLVICTRLMVSANNYRHSGPHFVIGTKMDGPVGPSAEFVIPAKAGIQEGRGGENVARGLVPRWGGAWAWQNRPREFAAQNGDFVFSYLGVPAQAGMSDWYENDVTCLAT